MKEFGEKLRELRMDNGESQKDLADVLNISFQSVSKWESGLHLPDVPMIILITKHYNVDFNYFFYDQKEIKTTKEKIELNVNINDTGGVSVWTDFSYNNTIAPEAFTDKSRRRAGNGLLKTHPGPKNAFIFAIDKNNKICFFGHHINYSFPSCGPNSFFYSNIAGEKTDHPCFIVEDAFFEAKGINYQKSFEFVIPKDGFLISFYDNTIDAKRILEFIVPKKYQEELAGNNFSRFYSNNPFYRNILVGELDYCDVFLKDDKLILEKEEMTDLAEAKNGKTIFMEKVLDKVNKLEKTISALREEVNNLEERIEELE